MQTLLFFFKKIGSGMHSDTKFCQRGGMLVIPMPGKNSSGLHHSENFQNGILACSITKIPLDIRYVL
jgi:hypothetical protein